MHLAVQRRLVAIAARCVRFSSSNFDSATCVLSSSSKAIVPQDVNFVDYVWRNHTKWEREIALTCGVSGREWSYGATFGAIQQLSGALPAKLGLRPGDVVALALPNCPEFVVAFFGAAAAGLIVSPLNPASHPDEMSKLLELNGAKAIITTASLAEAMGAAVGGRPLILAGADAGGADAHLTLQKLLASWNRGAELNEKPPPEAVAALPFSSGTTGLPKGVVLTHRNLVANVCGIDHPDAAPKFKNNGHSVSTIALLPFFHIYGTVVFLGMGLSRGDHLVTLPKFEPQSFSAALSKHKPTYLFLVPPLMTFIARSPSVTKEALSNLQFAATGAAPVSNQILKEFIEKTKSASTMVKNGYGLTEVSGAITITASGVDVSDSASEVSIGRLSANARAKVVDAAGNALPLGASGELWLQGPQVMSGYLDNQAATDATITPDGWLRTGDVARFELDGSVFIVDRLKELIKVKGFQVSASELEALLLRMDGVSDAAVIGVANEALGEAPLAFVVAREGVQLSEADVRAFVEAKAAKHKWLAGGVTFVQAIPRSPSGKILKKELKKLLL